MKSPKGSYNLMILAAVMAILASFSSANSLATDIPEMRDVIAETRSLNLLMRGLNKNHKMRQKVPLPKVSQQTPLLYQENISKAASDHQVPPSLIAAVIKCESNWVSSALSLKGARGLMQILPSTAKGEFGANSEDLWNPSINIYLGAAYLRLLANRYPGDSARVIAAYNAGPGRIDSGRPIPKETKRYLHCVHHWVKIYQLAS